MCNRLPLLRTGLRRLLPETPFSPEGTQHDRCILARGEHGRDPSRCASRGLEDILAFCPGSHHNGTEMASRAGSREMVETERAFSTPGRPPVLPIHQEKQERVPLSCGSRRGVGGRSVVGNARSRRLSLPGGASPQWKSADPAQRPASPSRDTGPASVRQYSPREGNSPDVFPARVQSFSRSAAGQARAHTRHRDVPAAARTLHPAPGISDAADPGERRCRSSRQRQPLLAYAAPPLGASAAVVDNQPSVPMFARARCLPVRDLVAPPILPNLCRDHLPLHRLLKELLEQRDIFFCGIAQQIW